MNTSSTHFELRPSTLRRFPLIARQRPPCIRLTERLARLESLAVQSADEQKLTLAASVFNQAALLASDVGLHDYATHLCHEHARLWFEKRPLTGNEAIHALEPLVNLARLAIRQGDPATGRRQLAALQRAVTTGTSLEIATTTLPSNLTREATDRSQAADWLARVSLAEGTRAVVLQGDWVEALNAINRSRGMGKRMLDGRQVAVIHALVTSDSPTAKTLLENTHPGEKWEQVVTQTLSAMYRRAFEPARFPAALEVLVASLDARPERPELAVFDLRLSLTALDLMQGWPEAARVEDHLLHVASRQVIDYENGYAARELLDIWADDMRIETARPALEGLLQSCGLTDEAFSQSDLEGLRITIRTARHVFGVNADLT